MNHNYLRVADQGLSAKVAAKKIYEKALREQRELYDGERAEFYEYVALAKKSDAAMKALESPQGAISMDHSQTVLPTNGRLPSESQAAPFVRCKKLRAFRNESDALDAGQYFRALVARTCRGEVNQAAEDHCHRRGWKLTNAGGEGSGVTGGYLVPTPLAQTIIDVRESVGVARKILAVMPMGSDTLSIARRAEGLTVYYKAENHALTDSDKSWNQIELIAKQRGVAHFISQELQEDAIISVVDDAVAEMAYALADKEDEETINGDGTSTYGGVLGLKAAIGTAGVVDAATGHDTWGELDVADFTAAISRLPDKYSRDPVWVCSHGFYSAAMLRLLVSGGGNWAGTLQAGDNGQRNFLGYRVYLTDKMPRTSAASTVCALFGTFSMGAILGERTGIRVGRSDEYRFLHDQIALKSLSRYDIKVHAPGDDTNAGCYVALKTASGGG